MFIAAFKKLRTLSLIPIAAMALCGLVGNSLADTPFDYTMDTDWNWNFNTNYNADKMKDVQIMCHHALDVIDTNGNQQADFGDERTNVAAFNKKSMFSNMGLAYMNSPTPGSHAVTRQDWIGRLPKIQACVKVVPANAPYDPFEAEANPSALFNNTHGSVTQCFNLGEKDQDGVYKWVEVSDTNDHFVTVEQLYGPLLEGERNDSCDCFLDQMRAYGEIEAGADPSTVTSWCIHSDGGLPCTGNWFDAVYRPEISDPEGNLMFPMDDFSSLPTMVQAGYIATNLVLQGPFPKGDVIAYNYTINQDCQEDFNSDARPITRDMPHAICDEDGEPTQVFPVLSISDIAVAKMVTPAQLKKLTLY